MSMQRTIRVGLKPTPEQADALRETLRQHTECFNAVCAYGWQHQERNGVRLHHATYRALRERFPALPSQLVVAARERAREALRSAFGRARRGKKASQPRSRLCPIRYDARTYALRAAKGYVSLASVAGRLKVPFALDPHTQGILDQAVGFDSADMIHRKGRFWLHIVVTISDVEFQPSGDVVGVDMGLSRPAVCSHNRFFGKRRWKEIERRYFRLRRSLQRKGTRSAKRHLRKLAGKVNRFRRDCDHVLSRRIVDSVQPGTVIVVENLVDIRSRTKQRGRESRRRLHSWSFARLRSFLAYKAAAKGCKVVGVDPRHTSQMCSRCGHVHRRNRRSQSRFLCRACGFELNADLNAARNIARKYLASGATCAAGGPLSTGLACQPA
ncbi:RNA-guided endonuclease InsQ/TnpB family protein [Pyrinomonas methylaliphatogenes]|uniref:Transposase, IS605 OrfB family, central region n=1 Tax=Pyrinomonas methylaliphatogenes TaxID=454194 RepID=A0A0B6WX93_9BACT|nr:RNA-guided endonuclease TnpB family protein [Pyrinomonas methylaliphatogenes]CDM65676.1 transposase, IS605 OrfB family, central region [Pyrinomonas methylaliphatogenes]